MPATGTGCASRAAQTIYRPRQVPACFELRHECRDPADPDRRYDERVSAYTQACLPEASLAKIRL
jgi:hypothetical protein